MIDCCAHELLNSFLLIFQEIEVSLFIAGKKEKTAPSDDSKVRLSHPDHVRVLIGDLSDGVPGNASDDELSESEEEEDENGSDEEVRFHAFPKHSRHSVFFSFIRRFHTQF